MTHPENALVIGVILGIIMGSGIWFVVFQAVGVDTVQESCAYLYGKLDSIKQLEEREATWNGTPITIEEIEIELDELCEKKLKLTKLMER